MFKRALIMINVVVWVGSAHTSTFGVVWGDLNAKTEKALALVDRTLKKCGR